MLGHLRDNWAERDRKKQKDGVLNFSMVLKTHKIATLQLQFPNPAVLPMTEIDKQTQLSF